jgi:hypothetical protein
MVQGGEELHAKIDTKPENTNIRAEDIAVAAIFSALGAAAPEIVKDPTARWVCCLGIGLCVGIYGTNMAVDFKNREEK